MADTVNDSKFNMLRTLVAMAHADGHFSPEEEAYLTAFMNRLPLSDEQTEILQSDFVTPQDPEEFLDKIEEKKYRSQVVYFARVLAFIDNEKHPSEEELLQKIISKASPKEHDIAIKADVHEFVQDQMKDHDQKIDYERFKTYKGRTSFSFFDRVLLKLGIDMLK